VAAAPVAFLTTVSRETFGQRRELTLIHLITDRAGHAGAPLQVQV
jgi:hypothetical protein